MGGSSKHNGTKHSEKGPSISSSNPGGQPASDSTMYFNEALARRWRFSAAWDAGRESALAELRFHAAVMREKFDLPGMGVHVALQCSAFQGDLHRVRCLPAT
jgi:hypothetical protein